MAAFLQVVTCKCNEDVDGSLFSEHCCRGVGVPSSERSYNGAVGASWFGCSFPLSANSLLVVVYNNRKIEIDYIRFGVGVSEITAALSC